METFNAVNNTVNRIKLIGHMGAILEMRFTANGTSVINFSVATNRIWRDQSGETRKATDWHRVTVWGGWPKWSTRTWAKASASESSAIWSTRLGSTR